MCLECKQAKAKLEEHSRQSPVDIGTTSSGFTVFRVPHEDGGFKYISDSHGGGWEIVPSGVSAEELSLVVSDKESLNKPKEKKPYKDVHTEHCCAQCGCKYGEEGNGCTVYDKLAKQSYPCTGECNAW